MPATQQDIIDAFVAVMGRNLEMVKALIGRVAGINSIVGPEVIALQRAKENGHVAIAAMLRS